MTFLSNALNKIAQEEKNKSVKQRLTSLQKNRIALNYIKFREGQTSDVGYTSVISQFTNEIENNDTLKPFEKKKVENMVDQMNDYNRGKSASDPHRTRQYVRTQQSDKRHMKYGINPYQSQISIKQRQRNKAYSKSFNHNQNYNNKSIHVNLNDTSSASFAIQSASAYKDQDNHLKVISQNLRSALKSENRTKRVQSVSFSTTQRVRPVTSSTNAYNYTQQVNSMREGGGVKRYYQQRPMSTMQQSRKTGGQVLSSYASTRPSTSFLQDKLNNIKSKCNSALSQSNHIEIVKEMNQKMVYDQQEQKDLKQELQKIGVSIEDYNELEELESKMENEENFSFSDQISREQWIQKKRKFQIKQLMSKYQSLQRYDDLKENLDDYQMMQGYQSNTLSQFKQSQNLNPNSSTKFQPLNPQTQTAEYDVQDFIEYQNALSYGIKTMNKSNKDNKSQRGISPFQRIQGRKSQHIPDYRKEEILEERAEKTLQILDKFEKNESFNKKTLKEISDKYKEFNFRRNQRKKDRVDFL